MRIISVNPINDHFFGLVFDNGLVCFIRKEDISSWLKFF